MCQILDKLQSYCPMKPTSKELHLPDGTQEVVETVELLDILMGGDQLTCARARTSKWLRSSHDNPQYALKGVTPVVEDWHARMCLLKASFIYNKTSIIMIDLNVLSFIQVIWTRLYKHSSSMERGTLYQLKNVLNRSSVKSDPGKNMKACEDFFSIVLSSHVVVAARTILKECSKDLTVNELSKAIVGKFVNFLSNNNHGLDMPDKVSNLSSKDDLVYVYACEVISLGLLWHSYHDTIKEGDGERIMTIWKYLLLVFHSSHRKNYTKEAIILLLQHHYLFSERMGAQLVWDRFVNTQGRIGCNVPADLHMEHLNRRFKTVLGNLGANIQPHTIVRASKAIGIVHSIMSTFENQLGKDKDSGKHTVPSAARDTRKVVGVLEEADIFVTRKRKHDSFKFKKGLLSSIDREKFSAKVLNKSLHAVLQL